MRPLAIHTSKTKVSTFFETLGIEVNVSRLWLNYNGYSKRFGRTAAGTGCCRPAAPRSVGPSRCRDGTVAAGDLSPISSILYIKYKDFIHN